MIQKTSWRNTLSDHISNELRDGNREREKKEMDTTGLMKWWGESQRLMGVPSDKIESNQTKWKKSIFQVITEVNLPELNKAVTLEEFITIFW